MSEYWWEFGLLDDNVTVRLGKQDIPVRVEAPGAVARQRPDFGTADGVLGAEYFSLGAGTDLAPLLEGRSTTGILERASGGAPDQDDDRA